MVGQENKNVREWAQVGTRPQTGSKSHWVGCVVIQLGVTAPDPVVNKRLFRSLLETSSD
jgi:hypothetical protein